MGKGNKTPKSSVIPDSFKSPRGGDRPQSILNTAFKWRTKGADFDGQWGWKNASTDVLFSIIIPKLHEFEGATWGVIQSKPHCHPVPLDEISREARERLMKIRGDAVDSLFSLLIRDKARLWGIKDRDILNLLWWDPQHSIYKGK